MTPHPLSDIRPATLARSTAIGDESAAEFARLMRDKGYRVKQSTPAQDRLKHVDFYCEKDGKVLAVDVKGRKTHSDTHILIEIRGIKGHAGSMFGDGFLAFHTGNEFLIVPRSALFAALKKKLNFSVSFKGGFNLTMAPQWTPDRLAICPKVYRRPDRESEMITFLPVEEVRALAVEF